MSFLLFKFAFVLNSALVNTVSDRVPADSSGSNVSSSKYCSSGRCALAANIVCRDVGVFGSKIVSL
jgi:hypothetical protein